MARDATMPGRVHVGLSAEAVDGPLGPDADRGVSAPTRAALLRLHARYLGAAD